ncbi:MAG: outer membrane protein assembly factor BamE [Verrucomicrobiota bacterium]
MKHILPLLVALLCGCASSSSRLNKLSVGMTKPDVLQAMGSPHSTSAKEGTEYMIYYLGRGNRIVTQSRYAERYFVRLKDGKVDAFGKMGDFDSTKDPTVNVNVRNK